MREAARLGPGVALLAVPDVLPDLESGALQRVLPRWYAESPRRSGASGWRSASRAALVRRAKVRFLATAQCPHLAFSAGTWRRLAVCAPILVRLLKRERQFPSRPRHARHDPVRTLGELEHGIAVNDLARGVVADAGAADSGLAGGSHRDAMGL